MACPEPVGTGRAPSVCVPQFSQGQVHDQLIVLPFFYGNICLAFSSEFRNTFSKKNLGLQCLRNSIVSFSWAEFHNWIEKPLERGHEQA